VLHRLPKLKSLRDLSFLETEILSKSSRRPAIRYSQDLLRGVLRFWVILKQDPNEFGIPRIC
jgi:hypothetical protein